MLKEALRAVISELESMRLEGIKTVFINEGTLEGLEAVSRKLSAPPVSESSPSLAVAGVTAPAAPTPAKPSVTPAEEKKRLASDRPTLVMPKPIVLEETAKKPEASLFPLPPPSKARSDSGKTELPPPPQLHLVCRGNKAERLEELRQTVLACPVCNDQLRPGKKLVFGEGNPDADIFFCGEAPGEEEEASGQPFVGPAGQLLTKLVIAMHLSREQVYIGNILKWRPDNNGAFGNRKPNDQEIAFCMPYLKAQLAIIAPKVIVALGATAVEGLLGVDPNRKMKSARGKWHEFAGIPLMITYHPSYVLRNNTRATKLEVWSDMLKVLEHLGYPITDKQRSYLS